MKQNASRERSRWGTALMALLDLRFLIWWYLLSPYRTITRTRVSLRGRIPSVWKTNTRGISLLSGFFSFLADPNGPIFSEICLWTLMLFWHVVFMPSPLSKTLTLDLQYANLLVQVLFCTRRVFRGLKPQLQSCRLASRKCRGNRERLYRFLRLRLWWCSANWLGFSTFETIFWACCSYWSS